MVPKTIKNNNKSSSLLRLECWQKKIIKTNLTIIMYHSVVNSSLPLWNWTFISEKSFYSQMRYLKKHFEIIRLTEAVERLNSTKKPAVVITFDDGYQNNYDIAFPILQQEKIPATIFLTTGLINTDDTTPLCRLHHAFQESNKETLFWKGSIYKLSIYKDRSKTMGIIKKKLKQMVYSQMTEEIRKIISKLGVVLDHSIERDSPFRMLDHKSIKKMLASGLIDFGAHTVSHPILSRISDEEQKNEIGRSIDAVSQLTNKPCNLFGYPNGIRGDYTDGTIKILQSFGIDVAVTANEGVNRTTTSPLELCRYGVGADKSLFSFICNVHNIKPFFKRKLLIK